MDSPLEAAQVSPENALQDPSENIKTAVATLEPPPTIHISNYRISHVYLNFRPMTYYAHVTRTIYDLNRLRIPLENRNPGEEKTSRSEPKDVNQEKGKSDVPGDKWTCDYKWLVTFMVLSIVYSLNIFASMANIYTSELRSALETPWKSCPGVSIYVYNLGTMLGAFFFAPASEIYGRAPMIRLGCGFFLVFNFSCGFSRTHFQLAVMRFFCGIFAGAPTGLSQVVLAELWGKKRGRPLSLCSLAPTIGPCMGTIIGCLTLEILSWKRFFWLTSAVGCASMFVMSMFMPETYPLEDLKEVNSLQPEEGMLEIMSNVLQTLEERSPSISPSRLEEQAPSIAPSRGPSLLDPCALQDALRALIRPIHIAWKEPTALVIGLQLSFIYIIFCITQCSLIHIFRYDHKQTMKMSGLHCLSIIFGACLASKMNTRCLSTMCDKLHIKNPHPDDRLEYKLRCMIPGTFVLAIGSVMFALARQYHACSAVFDVALFFIGAAMTLAGRKATTYVIDKHKEQAASALVVSSSFRRLASFVIPFAVHLTKPMQHSTKLEKFIPVVLLVFILPTPWVLFKYKAKACRETHHQVTV